MRLLTSAAVLFFAFVQLAISSDWQITLIKTDKSLLAALTEPPGLKCVAPIAAVSKNWCKKFDAGEIAVAREPFSRKFAVPLPEVPVANVMRAKDTQTGVSTLPHGWVGYSENEEVLTFLGSPTDLYPHGVFGEQFLPSTIAGAFKKTDVIRVFGLSDSQVFEDLTVRLIDLDGFGSNHLITILSEITQGASLAVFELKGDEISLLAQTPYIGTPNRWLNIAGIDDFDGSGSSSIALVETPHIGGTLQFWRWSEGSLAKIAEAAGFSNHKFGSREQRLSAVEDFDNDGVSDLAVPSADRKSLRLVRVLDGEVVDIATVSLPSPIDKAIGVTRQGDDVVLTVGLENGSVWAVHR